MARTAIAAGGVVVTRVRATGLRTDPRSGVIDALRAEDLTTGAELEIRTRSVVDATGVWAAEPDHPFKGASMRILPSRGAHLVVPRARIPNTIGLTIRVPGKIVFLVPWPDHWLIGTTDAPFDGPADRPPAAGWEVDRLLDTVNATMNVDLTRADVVGTYAGLRPLIAPSDGSTVKASREHRVTDGAERRRPDRWREVHDLPGDGARRHRRGPRPGRAGAPERHRRAPAGRGGRPGRPGPDRVRALDHRGRPRGRTGGGGTPRRPPRDGGAGRRRARRASWTCVRPLVAGRPFLEAEVAWAVRHELAESLDDVLARRTRLAQELPDRGAAIAPRVAEIMAADLGWGAARQALEVENYLAFARREFSVAAPEADGARERPPPSRGT